MNDAQVKSYIKWQKDKIEAWKKEKHLATMKGEASSLIKSFDQRMQATQSALDDFMSVLDNG